MPFLLSFQLSKQGNKQNVVSNFQSSHPAAFLLKYVKSEKSIPCVKPAYEFISLWRFLRRGMKALF